jgi:4-amino-4-deoxy-L-arabinose transferase-like glycosyltransferase
LSARVTFPVRLALLVGLLALLLLPAAGEAPLERAEIYFVDAARAMVEGGDYLVPHYRGEPFFDKPPLTYWLVAAAFRAFSFSLEAARLVPALAALMTLLVTVWLGTQLFDRDTGLLGGLLLATTLGFASFGRIVMSDMLLALLSTLVVGLGVSAVRGSEPAAGRRLLGLALAGGLGFLSKGPIAILLPALGLALLVPDARTRLRAIPLRLWAAAIAVFVLLASSWFVLVYARLGRGPLEYFFLRENLERFAGETYDSGQSPFYFLGVYLAEGLPWSPLLLPSLLTVIGERGIGAPGAASARFLAAWVGLMLVPLSLSRGKLDYYLLPAYPALSLLIAAWLRRERAPAERVFLRLVLALGASACAAAPLLADRLPPAWLPGPTPRLLVSAAVWLVAGALLLGALRFTPGRAVGLLALAFGLGFSLVNTLFVPALRRAQPNAAIVADVLRERSFRSDLTVVACQDPTRVSRDLLFEARVAMLERCDLWAPAASAFPYLLLVADGQQESLRVSTRFVARYDYVPGEVTTLSRLADGVSRARLVLIANYSTAEPEANRRVRKERKQRVQGREHRNPEPREESGVP